MIHFLLRVLIPSVLIPSLSRRALSVTGQEMSTVKHEARHYQRDLYVVSAKAAVPWNQIIVAYLQKAFLCNATAAAHICVKNLCTQQGHRIAGTSSDG